MEQGDGTYRCEKCMRNKKEFKWRIMLQLNMADCSDNIWASCFQVGRDVSHLLDQIFLAGGRKNEL